MKTCDCQCADAPSAPLDPRKHVNFVQGMVLGVDDLGQEFIYNQNQRQWLARDAIGYGTLSGLRVTFEPDLKLHVTPGTALSPRGRLIRVAPEQCAEINKWLDLEDTKDKIKDLGDQFRVHVVLCFRDCKVDELPVPGEPCRCEDAAMAPSRILDDFRLELRLTAPAQREEDAVRDFVQWLRQIKVSDAGSGTMEDLLDAIRDAAKSQASPPESPPDFLHDSPPQNLVIPSGKLCEYLRAALKLWVVELRPRWQAQWATRIGGGCECHGPEKTEKEDAEECLLLAALDLTLTGGHVTVAGDVQVDDSSRPFVVHLRMLQEMLLCGPCCGGGCNDRSFATVFALDDHTLRIWIHHASPVAFDETAVQLKIDDAPVTGFTVTQAATTESPPGGSNVFDLELGTSPPVTLKRSERVELKLDTHLMAEAGSPSRTLAEVQAADGWCYPDTQDGVVTARAIVDLSGAITLPPIPEPAEDGVPGDLPAAENKFTPVPGSSPVLPTGSAPAVGGSEKFARADHTHGTPPDPIPPHNQDATAHRNLRLGDANPSSVPPQSDVRGTAELNKVVGLQGRAVANLQPANDGDTLAWSAASSRWEPRAAPASGITIKDVAEKLPTLPLVTITQGPRVNGLPTFDLWFHVNAGPTFSRSNLPELTTFKSDAVAVFAESNQPAPTASPFMTRRPVESASQIDRNVYRLLMAGTQVDKDSLLRFIFDEARMGITPKPGDSEINAADWITSRPVKWVGHDGAKSLTAFFRNTAIQAAASYVAVAAGRFRRDGAPIGRVLGGANATPHPQIGSSFFISFADYKRENSYVVTGTPVLKIPSEDNPFVMVVGDTFMAQGIQIWLRPGVPSGGFMVQVHQIL